MSSFLLLTALIVIIIGVGLGIIFMSQKNLEVLFEDTGFQSSSNTIVVSGVIEKKIVYAGTMSQWSYFILKTNTTLLRKPAYYLLNEFHWQNQSIPTVNPKLTKEQMEAMNQLKVQIEGTSIDTNSINQSEITLGSGVKKALLVKKIVKQ